MKFLLISAAFIFLSSACGKNTGKIGGAFSAPQTANESEENIPGTRFYIKAEHVGAIESMQIVQSGVKDPKCALFKSKDLVPSYSLLGLKYTTKSFFTEIQGQGTGIFYSSKSVAKLLADSSFEFIDRDYIRSENQFMEDLVATFRAEKMIVSLKRLQNSGDVEKQAYSILYLRVSTADLTNLNDDLSYFCR